MVIDYSQLQCYISCPKKYHNKYVRKVRKARFDGRDLDANFGRSVHEALEHYYKGGSKEEAIALFVKHNVDIPGEEAKTTNNGKLMLQRYFDKWENDTTFMSDKNLKTIAVEIQDSYMIGDIEYLVKIDRIVESNAGIFVMDHKTTGSTLNSRYFSNFNYHMQFDGYCNYVKKKYGQCSGAIINALKCGFRKRAYRGEPAGFHCDFDRDVTTRDVEQLADFERNVTEWTRKIKNDTFYARNKDNCTSFRGCGYKELCMACDDINVEDTLYEQYDPLEYLKGGEK